MCCGRLRCFLFRVGCCLGSSLPPARAFVPLRVAALVSGIFHPEALTPTALDYFGAGALLAWLFERGVSPGHRRIRGAGLVSFAAYAVLYSFAEAGREVPLLGHFQQTFLSIACASLIAASFLGLRGAIGRALVHPSVQHVGRLSYGLYLFHAAAPLALGKVCPWLWTCPVFDGPLLLVRIAAFAVLSFALAEANWRWLESPRSKRAAAMSTA